MRKNLLIALSYTVVTGILLGIVYPLAMTALAQFFFRDKANGQLILDNGVVVGSSIIGQGFTGSGYFHSRPSAAGANGYDAASSGASNYGSTSKKYIDRVAADVSALKKSGSGADVPIDLVTTSASGLDPDITPAAAEFQVARVAQARGVPETQVRAEVAKFTSGRQLGFLGEPRVNVLLLNRALDTMAKDRAEAR
jgi:K+-transporting ATPase ATPase C chain